MTTEAADPPAALELRGVSKRFGAVAALSDVDLRVRPGTVHALLGENGAGKSTLMHIAAGLLAPDGGDIVVNGRSVTDGDIRSRGIGMVHQHLSLVPTMTAAENFALGGRGMLRAEEARRRLRALSDASGLRVDTDRSVREMSLVQQQRIEILKALGQGASLIIMDEPTAVLAPSEADDLLAWTRSFVERGGSVVLVTHKLREALAVADHITVLRRGRVAWSGTAADSSETTLAQSIFPDRASIPGTPAVAAGRGILVTARELTLLNERRQQAVTDATFDIARGDIVGVAAVEGSGQRELLSALAGQRSPASGVLVLPPQVAFIPADRRRDAIIPSFTLTENVALRGLGRRRGIMPWRELRARTARLIEAFSIAAPAPESRASVLSGGNQQRLVVARELTGEIDLVVAENPSRGLDLAATAFVHDQLRRAAAGGAAVVVHSSDLDEVLGLATRVLVMFHGRVAEMPNDRDAIGRAMLGMA